mgnify:CR=1 FL=1
MQWSFPYLLNAELLKYKGFISNSNQAEFTFLDQNGREVKKIVNKEKIYGKFCPGLIIYNPETGKIPWIAPECLFEDPDARTITFSSDFLRTEKQSGILYAHVNDSFIRAYKIDANELKKLLPKNF